MEDILGYVVQALIPLLGVLVTFVIGQISRLLKSQIKKIENEQIRGMILSVKEEAERVAVNAVNQTNQTLVDELKEQAENGKLSQENARNALNKAKVYFRTHISKAGLETLEKEYGDLDRWIEDLIEAKIKEQKNVKEQIRGLSDPN